MFIYSTRNDNTFEGKTKNIKKCKKNVKKWLTERSSDDRINLALIEVRNTERYRSGHNEAVLKTVCPQGHMGSKSHPLRSLKIQLSLKFLKSELNNV